MGQVPADRLMAELDISIREHVGPVGRLVLRKKWRDLGIGEAPIGDQQAGSLIDQLNSALSIIMGDEGATAATARLRERALELGLDV